MKRMAGLFAIILCGMLLFTSVAGAVDDGFTSTYTYNYDYWSEVRESPDAYRVDQMIYSTTLGLETPMRRPQSLFVQGDLLYVVDTGNNRILEIRREDGNFSLVKSVK